MEPPPGSRSPVFSGSPHGLAVRRANSGCADKAASKRSLRPSCTARDQLPDPAEGVGRASHELLAYPYRGWLVYSFAMPLNGPTYRLDSVQTTHMWEGAFTKVTIPAPEANLAAMDAGPRTKKPPQRMTSKG